MFTSSTLVDTCWSEDCVQEAFTEAMAGDTVTIAVHHGGSFRGMSVYSKNK